MTELEMLDRLKIRHPAPAWATFGQVRNQTGFRKARVRTCDAIALSLWPFNGLVLHGFEFKDSATDTRRELDDPGKAAEFSEFCDYWWLVISKPEIIAGIALPDSWGVLVPHAKTFKALKEAPKRNAKPLDRAFVCGVIRTFHDAHTSLLRGMVPMSAVDETVRQRVESQSKVWKDDAERKYIDLLRAVEEFEQASGLSIRSRWQNGSIGAAVKLLTTMDTTTIDRWARDNVLRLDQFRGELQAFSDTMPMIDVANPKGDE